MKNYGNRIVQGAIIIAVFAIGLLVGRQITYRKFAAYPLNSMRTLSMVSVQGDIAKTQYLYANHKEAKAALLNYINLLDDLKSKGMVEKEQYFNLGSYYAIRGLTYARLALLEEKAGNTAGAKMNMQEAIKMSQMAGWKDDSEPKIRDALERLDKK